MNIANVQNGSQIAVERHGSSIDCAHSTSRLTTLHELLAVLENDPPKSLPMLRSTASKVAEFYKLRLEEVSLDRVHQMRGQFRRYLEARTYAENSIRSYVNYAHILMQQARKFGWRPYQSLPEAWQQILALASKKKCTDPARSLALVRRTPQDVTVEDVDAWGERAFGQGASALLRSDPGQLSRNDPPVR
jgi:hypothetical protein